MSIQTINPNTNKTVKSFEEMNEEAVNTPLPGVRSTDVNSSSEGKKDKKNENLSEIARKVDASDKKTKEVNNGVK